LKGEPRSGTNGNLCMDAVEKKRVRIRGLTWPRVVLTELH
jgi:hypothetical protein